MIPYLLSWGMLAWPVLGRSRHLAGSSFLGLLFFFTILIGLRDRVGGDWFNYFPYLQRSIGIPLADVFLEDEPGYGLLNWIAANGGGMSTWSTPFVVWFSPSGC